MKEKDAENAEHLQRLADEEERWEEQAAREKRRKELVQDLIDITLKQGDLHGPPRNWN